MLFQMVHLELVRLDNSGVHLQLGVIASAWRWCTQIITDASGSGT